MLISLHLGQYKDVKLRFQNFFPQTAMFQNNFVVACTLTIRPIHTVFSSKHAALNLNEIDQFQSNLRIFTWIRAWMDKQTNRSYKYFLALLASIKKIMHLSIRFVGRTSKKSENHIILRCIEWNISDLKAWFSLT